MNSTITPVPQQTPCWPPLDLISWVPSTHLGLMLQMLGFFAEVVIEAWEVMFAEGLICDWFSSSELHTCHLSRSSRTQPGSEPLLYPPRRPLGAIPQRADLGQPRSPTVTMALTFHIWATPASVVSSRNGDNSPDL